MSEVQRFWSHEASNIRCVREADFDELSQDLRATQEHEASLIEDFDRVTAERDAANETLERWHELNLQREEKVDALQQRLTAADELIDSTKAELAWQESDNAELRKRAGELEGLLRDCKAIFKRGVSEIGFISHASLYNRMECAIEEIDAAIGNGDQS